MRLTKDVYLAAELLQLLGTTPQRVSDLATRLLENQTAPTKSNGKSEFFLARIVNKMGKAGLIRVTRGPRGGVSVVTGTTVTLYDVYKALSRPLPFTKSPRLAGINQQLVGALKGISVLPIATQVYAEQSPVQEGEA